MGRVTWLNAERQAVIASLHMRQEYYNGQGNRDDRRDRAGISGSGVEGGRPRGPEKTCDRKE